MRTFNDLFGRATRLAGILGLLGGVAVAQQTLSPSAMRQIQDLMQEKDNRTPAQKKLDSHLHYAVKMMRGQPISVSVSALPRVMNNLSIDTGGRVLVDIRGTIDGALLSAITAAGGQVLASTPQYGVVRAQLPALSLEKMASRPDVRFISPGEIPVHAGNPLPSSQARHRLPAALPTLALRKGLGLPRLGFSMSMPIMDLSGYTAHGVGLVHSRYNLDGTGIRIGVLSDGVASLSSLTAQGYLPNVTVMPNMAGPTDGDEGTAMLEIVHDLAPGAQLFYATAYWGQYQTAANIEALRNTYNCDIIVDDITYLEEPVFQDGIIAQAINTVTASGALYFSAAGNSGSAVDGSSDTWEGDYADSGSSISSLTGSGQGEVHAFSPGTIVNVVRSGAQSSTLLQWSDPYSQACNDYDLYILDPTGKNVVSSSTNLQSCPNSYAPPLEEAGQAQSGEQIVITLHQGSPRALHLAAFRGQLAAATIGGTFGHNAAASAVTVAAVPAWSAKGGLFTAGSYVEGFSSDGPRRIFYNPQGQEITPGNLLFSSNGGTLLQKPDLAAADGVSTAVPGFGAFYGTSAAAPHAAAIAALVKQVSPSATAAQVLAAIQSSAIDIMTPGPDINAGYGIVMALPAVTAMMNAITGVTSSTPNGTYGAGSSISVAVHFNRTVSVTGAPQLLLNSGGQANYRSGSGTSSLQFVYQVATGQTSNHLDYASANALSLNGGAIDDGGGRPVSLLLPAPESTGSLGADSSLAIDTSAPAVVSFSVGFGSEHYNLLGASQTALPWQINSVTAVFSKPIAKASLASLTGLTASSVSGLNTNTLTWALNPITSGRLSAGLEASTVADAAGNPLAGNFKQSFTVLYGDTSGDGVVNSTDLLDIFTATRKPYSIWADLDGNGAVNIGDLLIVRSRLGATLP